MDTKQIIADLEKEIHNITNQKKVKQNIFNYEYAKKEEEFSKKVNENYFILQEMKACARKEFLWDIMFFPSTIMILGGFANVLLGVAGVGLLIYSKYKSIQEAKKHKQKLLLAKEIIKEAKELKDMQNAHNKEIESLNTEQVLCNVEKKRLENFVNNLQHKETNIKQTSSHTDECVR